jgi:3-oxoacyl-[acyl-carrier protein] reductase
MRTALVMAGTKGIGRGCAEQLARGGTQVAVCARTREDVAATAAELRALGVEALGVAADVADPEQLAGVFTAVDATFGRLDVLVANAGGPPPGTFDDLDEDGWRTGYERTLMSAVRAIRHALPRMRAVGGGRVIIIGSSSVRLPVPGITLSNTFRPALAGLTKSLAEELGRDGITVNMVSPGRIDTERVRALDERVAGQRGTSVEEARRAAEGAIPMGRYGTPSEIGALVAFLASPEAAYITGQTPLVDGGMVPTLP